MRIGFLLAALVIGAASDAQGSACGPLGCPAPPAAPTPATVELGAVVRIRHASPGGVSYGSGTHVARRDGASWYATCAHLFDERAGVTEVKAEGHGVLRAEVVAVDRANDLALLRTQESQAAIVTVSTTAPRGVLTACGYGPNGERRCVSGPVLGVATPRGASAPSLRLRGAVRPGDSGGPVFDAWGRLVAVLWGTSSGETYATFGGPLRRLLARVPQRESRVDPVSPWSQPTPQRPIEKDTPDGWAALEDLGATGLMLAGLGVGGPIGAALLVGKFLVRARKRRARAVAARTVAVDAPPPPQRVARQTHYVAYENDAFAQAHQWACEQLARKFPGSVELLTCLDSLIKQALAGARERSAISDQLTASQEKADR